jgi:hypothetical protein
MFSRSSFYRVIAVPACVAWGIIEIVALQRARWQQRHKISTRAKEATCSGNI